LANLKIDFAKKSKILNKVLRKLAHYISPVSVKGGKFKNLIISDLLRVCRKVSKSDTTVPTTTIQGESRTEKLNKQIVYKLILKLPLFVLSKTKRVPANFSFPNFLQLKSIQVYHLISKFITLKLGKLPVSSR
jgi:hypothetical protein